MGHAANQLIPNYQISYK